MISLKSKITAHVLSYFYLNVDESLYVNELQRKLNVDKRNLVKKLHELEKEGILCSNTRGNMRLYSINKKYPLFDEYRKIILKSIGVEDRLKKIVQGLEGVKEAYIFGSFARDQMDASSDIDVLVVGDHSAISLQKSFSKVEKEIDRVISAVNMDEEEYKARKKDKDSFIYRAMKDKVVRLK